MSSIRLADYGHDLQAVLVERKRLERERFPDINIGDFIVLKNGPRAYKVATHWIIIDRNTGELHHHAVKIETYRRLRSGWEWDEEHSITLGDEGTGENEIAALTTFLASVTSVEMPTDPGDYLLLPLRREGEEFDLSAENLTRVIELSRGAGAAVLARLLGWVASSEDATYVIDRVEGFDIDSHRKLNTVLGVASLKSLLHELQNNLDIDDEEFWQNKFAENSYILTQVFAFPVIILKGKAYVGGKDIENTGGNVVDFLCANHLTRSSILIEIKTPATRLLGSQYRGDIVKASIDLTGSVLQISNYKNALLTECNSLARNSEVEFDVFDPPCLVIIGNAGRELDNTLRRKSFELFRSGLRGVQVITYDELLQKMDTLVGILEGVAVPGNKA